MSLAEQEEERAHQLRVLRSARVIQEMAQDSLDPWGVRVPGPTLGEPPDEYRRKLLIMAKKQLPVEHELRKIQVRQLRADALAVFEPQIYSACKAEAYNPSSVPPGDMRRIEEINPQNGMKIVKFIGQRSFVDQFLQPGRIAKIRDPSQFPRAFL
jgi:hypothetical protein